jgi:Mrp family chromosome partitioning ATPase
LNQTEDALKALKAKAGILDLKDSTLGLTSEATKMEDQLRTAEGDLAEQRARVKLMEGEISEIGATASNPTQPAPAVTASPSPGVAATASPAAQPTNEQIQQYKGLVTRLGELRKSEVELLSKYSDTASPVKSVRGQIADLETEKRNSEKKFPGLATLGSPQTDLGNERAKLAGLEARAAILKNQLGGIREQIKQLADTTPQIARLERNKDLEETNYKYFEGSLEKARVDEALDPSKMPNISAVQRPSPPSLVTKLRNKVALILGVGGLLLGLGISVGNELFLNRTVKRPIELEKQLRTPVLVAIPYGVAKNRLRLREKLRGRNGKQSDQANGKAEVAPWDPAHFIRPYSAAIRDRLGLYFELQGISHKPKLVGVTGFHEGAGSSTLAAGLAAALSETGEGKVLLVDANVPNGEAHQFFDGRPAMPLKGALESSAPENPAGDNLYLATIAPPNAHPARVGLKRFLSLMPNLKASEFDYVIFDLPPLNQTSPTIGLAGFMDKVLLVVEAEKNNRELVQRGYRELMGARADVSIVLNKVRSYLPKWLGAEV